MPQVQRILGSGVRAVKSEQEDELIHFCEKSNVKASRRIRRNDASA